MPTAQVYREPIDPQLGSELVQPHPTPTPKGGGPGWGVERPWPPKHTLGLHSLQNRLPFQNYRHTWKWEQPKHGNIMQLSCSGLRAQCPGRAGNPLTPRHPLKTHRYVKRHTRPCDEAILQSVMETRLWAPGGRGPREMKTPAFEEPLGL